MERHGDPRDVQDRRGAPPSTLYSLTPVRKGKFTTFTPLWRDIFAPFLNMATKRDSDLDLW